MDFNAIPDELKMYNSWVMWRYEDIEAKKPTKVPYSGINHKLAAVDDPQNGAVSRKRCKLIIVGSIQA